MAADANGKNYVLGKGRIYFDQFAPGTKVGTGERYFGNTPELSTTSDKTTLDHFDSDSGVNVKDASVTTEDNVTGSLTTDNISMENTALFYGGVSEDQTIVAATAVTETKPAKRGTWFQLGKTTAHPQGARNITNFSIKILTATVAQPNNYEVDLALARVYIEEAAPGITEGAALIYTYDITGGTREVVVGAGTEISGALRFISANPVGPQTDYYWPFVTLTANGDFSLKGDEWQQIPFSFEVLKLDANTERVYIERRTV